MKWTESNELKACLGILAQHTKLSFDAEEIRANWPVGPDGERPSIRTIKKRFAILKKRAEESYGNYKAPTTQAVQILDSPDAQSTGNFDPFSATPVYRPVDSLTPTASQNFIFDLTGQSAITPASKTPSLQRKSKSWPLSTGSRKPTTPSRKRKVIDSSESSDADDSATEDSPTSSSSTSSRPRPMALRAKSPRKYQIDDFTSFSTRELHDSEDSDTTFDLGEFHKNQAKEQAKAVARGRKRGRWGQGPSPRGT